MTADLPPAADLIAAARDILTTGGTVADVNRGVLDHYAPAIDRYVDVPGAAGWLGVKVASIHRDKQPDRQWADGTPGWPVPDMVAGSSQLWTYRTIVLHRAQMRGRGSAGRGRPARGRVIL